MKIDILTLFPEMFSPLYASIIGRATSDKKLDINIYDIREFSENKHKKCDDYPFGGGAGMVMTAQPIASAIEAIDKEHKAHRIYMSPKGQTLTQKKAQELSRLTNILILCGHYEGVDQRALDLYIDEEISIGDYILTGGEIPAMALVDSVSRLVDGVITKESLENESFENSLLEHAHYTRPIVFKGLNVPEVLRSGNHAQIEKWRRESALKLTRKNRPDLLNDK